MRKIFLFIFVLILANLFCWKEILFFGNKEEVYFFDLKGGESILFCLPFQTLILVDSGPRNGAILKNLSQILPFWKKRIDVFILTKTDLNHFGGLLDLISSYQIGVFIWDGSLPKSKISRKNFLELLKKLKEKNTKILVANKEDKIFYKDFSIEFFSFPNFKFEGGQKSFVFLSSFKKDLKEENLKAEILKFSGNFEKSLFLLKKISPKLVILKEKPNEKILNLFDFYGTKILLLEKEKKIKIPLK